jgi:hypothetical protein
MFDVMCRAFVVIVVSAIGMSGCSRQQPTPSTASPAVARPAAVAAAAASVIPTADRPPLAFVEITGAAEEIFDQARTSQWNEATVSVNALTEAAADLRAPALKADLVEQLRSRIATLQGSVKACQRVPSMDAANSVTQIIADLASPYQTKVPYQILLLGYYGRQIELGLAASRPSLRTQAIADLRQTWNATERSVLQHGDVDDARRFTDIVVQLEGAKQPADMVVPVGAERAAAKRLEKIFAP